MRTALTLILFAFSALAADQPKPEEAASISEVRLLSRVKPGTRAVVAVKIKLQKHYHTHSHEPSEPIYIPTVLKSNPPAGIKLLSVRYPKGKTKKIPGLPKPLSIYEDEVEIRLIFHLDDDITLPANIPSTLTYQACKGKICYRPAKVEFDIVLPQAP